MRSCLKTLVVGTGIVLILIAVVLILAATQLKTLARGGIERSLSLAFLTDVTTREVEIAFHEGHVEIHNLVVGNPASFRTGSAMEIETVIIDFDLKTLFSRTPTINQILIKNAHVNLRHELTEGTNLSMLTRHASRFSKNAQETAEGAVPTTDAPGRQFIIKELRCEGAIVAMSSNLIPRSGVKVEVDPFTLTEIRNDRPVSAAELSAIFIRSLIRQTLGTKGLLRPIADLLRDETAAAAASVSLIEEPETVLVD